MFNEGFGQRRRREQSPDEMYKRRRSISPRRREDHLMTYHQFVDFTRDQMKRSRNAPLEQEEMDRRYEIYKDNFMKKLTESFFKEQSNSEWFREKYHPVERLPLIAVIKERKKECFELFVKKLQEKAFDALCLDQVGEEKEEAPELFDNESNAIFIKSIPIEAKRKDLEHVFKQYEGFKYLAFADPRLDRRMARFAWIIFDNKDNMLAALPKLDGLQISDFQLQVAINQQGSSRYRYVSNEFLHEERLTHDLGQITKLSNHLDQEAELDGTKLVLDYCDSLELADPIAKVKKQLDLLIEYLNRVHQYDYYSGLESSSPEDHYRRLQPCLRKSTPREGKIKDPMLEKVDEDVQFRIEAPTSGPLLTRRGGKPLDVQLEKAISLYIRKETEGKFRCTECQKLFKGDEFVRKHIRAKHTHIVEEETESCTFFNLFATDLNKLDLTKKEERPSFASRPRPRPSQGRRDPRQMRSYHDLDAPIAGEIELKYD